jgi:branched-chain amino acid transport system permease protein
MNISLSWRSYWRKSKQVIEEKRALDLVLSSITLAVIAILPLFVTSAYWRGVLVVALYYSLAAMGWNLLGGYAGQFSIAPAAFCLIGMYTSALLVHYWNWAPQLGILMAIVSTAAIGLFLGWICLRLRGPYLALTTIAFAEITRGIIRFSYDITRGDLGLSVPKLYGGGGSHLAYYYTFLFVVVIVQILLYLLIKSKIGLYLQSIRDDEVAARGRGVNVVWWKTFAFALSSLICGLAGGLYVHFIGLASPEMGLIMQSGLIIGMTVIGGMGTLAGPLIGGLILQPLSEYVREFGVQHMVIFAFLIIIVVRFWRAGLYGSLKNMLERVVYRG